MQDNNKENQEQSSKLLNLTADDKRNLVGLFALLIKIDKRTNPHIYQIIRTQKND